MTPDEKRCAEVWEMVSGQRTSSSVWCDKAGDTLAEMLAAIRGCSKAMSFVPRPVGSRPGSGRVVGYVYQVLSQRYVKGEFDMCNVVGFSKWRDAITIALSDC